MQLLSRNGLCLLLGTLCAGALAAAGATAQEAPADVQLESGQQSEQQNQPETQPQTQPETQPDSPPAPQALTETIDSSTVDLLVPQPGEDRSLASWSEYYETSLENQEYGKAINAAVEMLTIAQDELGDDSRVATQATLALAWAQRGGGQIVQAARSYSNAIAMIERREGIFSPELIDPLVELGVTYARGGEEQLAVDAMLRARHITHRDGGLFNAEQIPIIDHLTEIYVATGEISDATREQRFAFRIVERGCDGKDACMVDGLYKMARWYSRTGRNSLARKLYRRAIDALEAEYGANDLRLVEPLQGIAASYEREGFRRKEGEKALERAVQIYTDQQYGDAIEHASALAKLGDWHTLNSDFDEAAEVYRRAWQVLVEQGATPAQANAFFAQPARLRYSPPIPVFNDQAWHISRIADSTVVVQFTVTGEGRVEDATVVEADVSRRVYHDVRDAVKRARYRPRVVDGELVSTTGVQLQQSFTYLRDLPQQQQDDPFARRNPTCPPRCEY